MAGLFITFEGSEGCGKSTHIKRLKEYFEAQGRECVLSREPGGTPLAEKIRDLLLHAKEGDGMPSRTEILLFEAARADHVERKIKPALAEDKVVICDRFYDSTSAYQGAARQISSDDVDALNKFATGGLEPTLTVVLDIDVEVGLERAAKRDDGKTDRMGAEKIDFYKKVREGFLNLAKNNPRFAVVDSSGTADKTFEKIIKAVEDKIK